MLSLKRTLLFNIASLIEGINRINQGVSKSNLHSPLRYSAVLLSIGKTPQICHQNIPLKRIHCKEKVMYASAVSLKLAKICQQPADVIASVILTALQAQPSSLWSSVRKNNDGWIEFDISYQGMEQWRQQLTQWVLSDNVTPWSISPEALWQLQSGYELCCRWQVSYSQTDVSIQLAPYGAPTDTFLMLFPPLRGLIDGLLDIGDGWEDATPPQLLQRSKQLLLALNQCVSQTRPSSLEARQVCPWLAATQIVLKHLLHSKLGHQVAEQF